MAAKFDLNDDSVFVVIGSGAGGGTLGTELALKGSRDGRSHDFSASPGQACTDGNSWKINLWEGRHGQDFKRNNPGEGDRRREERGSHGPVNEGCRTIHAWPAGSGSLPASCRLDW